MGILTAGASSGVTSAGQAGAVGIQAKGTAQGLMQTNQQVNQNSADFIKKQAEQASKPS
jgi:hypothetical protein